MLEMKTSPGDGLIEIDLDEGRFPRDAVYAVSFAMIDRCWVHLDRAGEGRIAIKLQAKGPGVDLEAIGREFEGELYAQAWQVQIAGENRALLDAIVTKAFGVAPDPGAIDALLGGDEGAFEDPLGIALSWEEKYGQKAEGAGGQGP